MSSWFAMMIASGFLVYWIPDGIFAGPSFRRGGIRETLEMAAATVFLTALDTLIHRLFPQHPLPDASLFFLGAYLLQLVFKFNSVPLLAAFGICTFHLFNGSSQGSAPSWGSAAGMALGAGVFTLMMAGLRRRLVLFSPARFLEGLPASLLIASLLSLAFWGFYGILS